MTTQIKLDAPLIGIPVDKGTAHCLPGWHKLPARRRQKLARDYIAALREIETAASREIAREAEAEPVQRELMR